MKACSRDLEVTIQLIALFLYFVAIIFILWSIYIAIVMSIRPLNSKERQIQKLITIKK